ncbi:MAG: Rab family GTPase [Candidatus Hermodarchaeota archaeon]
MKICILGEKGVGISSWLQNCSGMYEVESYTLRNFGFGVKSIKLEDKTFKLQLWFLNAYRLFKKRFHRDLKLFETLIRGCNGVFLVYDITNIESLSRIPEWIHSIREICGNIPIVLLGNKSDLENLREISKEQDIEFVKKYEISGRYEISIKTGKNVNLPFQKISEIYFQKFLETKGE